MRGHRSELTRLFVSEITTPDGVTKTDNKPHVMDLDSVARKVEHKEKHKAQKGALKSAAGDWATMENAPAKKAKSASAVRRNLAGAKKAGAKKAGASKAKAKSKKITEVS